MHDEIEKTKQSLEEVEELKKSIFSKLKAWFEAEDLSKIDTHEFGEIVDVVKDFAEVNSHCWEALYYESIVKAMEEEKEMRGRVGYNSNRYPSSGRFASAGHGSRMGYPMIDPQMWMEMCGYPMGDVRTGYGPNAMPGYSGGSQGRSGISSGGGNSGSSEASSGYNSGRIGASGASQGYSGRSGGYSGYQMDPEYGRAYNMYRESRRHYTESKDPSSKKEMSQHANEHLNKTIHTFRDIWEDVDPEMKKKMKMELEKLVSEMQV